MDVAMEEMICFLPLLGAHDLRRDRKDIIGKGEVRDERTSGQTQRESEKE